MQRKKIPFSFGNINFSRNWHNSKRTLNNNAYVNVYNTYIISTEVTNNTYPDPHNKTQLQLIVMMRFKLFSSTYLISQLQMYTRLLPLNIFFSSAKVQQTVDQNCPVVSLTLVKIYPRTVSKYACNFTSIGIPIIKISRIHDHHIL